MTHRTVLFAMPADIPDAEIATMAQAAAERGDHLSCLILDTAPPLPFAAYGVPPYGAMNIPDAWNIQIAEAQEKQKERTGAVRAVLQKEGVSGHAHPVFCATMEIRQHVARAARVSDIAVIAPALRDHPDLLREAAYGVLFQSPIGLRLNGGSQDSFERVFIAWDSSKAAARAMHAALPYLKQAQTVQVTCIDPVMTPERDGPDPGTDVATWLSHHGCTVSVAQFPSGGQRIGEALQARAREFGADLLVMGAYGRSRMSEAVFGGTTRTLLEQTKLPVFMAH